MSEIAKEIRVGQRWLWDGSSKYIVEIISIDMVIKAKIIQWISGVIYLTIGNITYPGITINHEWSLLEGQDRP